MTAVKCRAAATKDWYCRPLAIPIRPQDLWDRFYSPYYAKDLFLFQDPRAYDMSDFHVRTMLKHRQDSFSLPRTAKIELGWDFQRSFDNLAKLIDKERYQHVFFTARLARNGQAIFYDDHEKTSEELGTRIAAEIYTLCDPIRLN